MTCSGCGTRRSQWDDDPVAFVGHAEICPGCEALEQERKNVPEEHASPAVRISLVPRALGEALMVAGLGVIE